MEHERGGGSGAARTEAMRVPREGLSKLGDGASLCPGDNKSPINEGEMADVGAPAGVRSSEGRRGWDPVGSVGFGFQRLPGVGVAGGVGWFSRDYIHFFL